MGTKCTFPELSQFKGLGVVCVYVWEGDVGVLGHTHIPAREGGTHTPTSLNSYNNNTRYKVLPPCDAITMRTRADSVQVERESI